MDEHLAGPAVFGDERGGDRLRTSRPLRWVPAGGVIQIFNVGAERMLGYAAADVVNKCTLADISDPQEVITRGGRR